MFHWMIISKLKTNHEELDVQKVFSKILSLKPCV